jgi:hypothetical protein
MLVETGLSIISMTSAFPNTCGKGEEIYLENKLNTLIDKASIQVQLFLESVGLLSNMFVNTFKYYGDNFLEKFVI